MEDGKYFLSGKLDELKQELIEYLCKRDLCSVWYKPKPAKKN